MDRVFFDTDVCLDIILKREPFESQVVPIIELMQAGSIEIFFSEGSIPNLIYISQERYKLSGGVESLVRWISTYSMVSSSRQSVVYSLQSDFKDKEDAYQYFTALHNEMDLIITRNKKDYEPYAKAIPVYTPSEFLTTYNTQ